MTPELDTMMELVLWEPLRERGPLLEGHARVDLGRWRRWIAEGREPALDDEDLARRLAKRWGWSVATVRAFMAQERAA